MKNYIKPNTELHKVELQQMIAATTPGVDPSGSTTPDESDAKGISLSSTSVWGEEE